MIACLAQEKLAFRGNLKDMCEFLGVSNSTPNKNKIKEAISILEEKEDIKVVKEGYTWTLTLSVKAEKTSRIIKIKNAYIQAIKNYKAEKDDDSVAWEVVLKVLVFLWGDKKEIRRYDEIAKALNISKHTAERAVRALVTIEFTDMAITKKLAWFKDFDGNWRIQGNKYIVGHKWN